jgi:hypothetical protein
MDDDFKIYPSDIEAIKLQLDRTDFLFNEELYKINNPFKLDIKLRVDETFIQNIAEKLEIEVSRTLKIIIANLLRSVFKNKGMRYSRTTNYYTKLSLTFLQQLAWDSVPKTLLTCCNY